MVEINTEIIRKAQDGDVAVIGELYEHFHVSIFRYLYYRVGDRQTAEDLTSEVFERMLRFISGFQPPSASFKSWLFQIARNISIDHYRKQRDHVTLEEFFVADHDRVEPNVERILTSQRLQEALAQISEDQRDVIILRFIAGMTIADSAEALNKSENAIKALQRRALAALRRILEDWEVSYA